MYVAKRGSFEHYRNKKADADASAFVEIPGFEPRQTEPKSVVLPLHHISIFESANVGTFFEYTNVLGKKF